MTAFAVHSLAAALPFGFRREMAQSFGFVEPGRRRGWAIRFEVDGQRHRITAIPVRSRWIPIATREQAEEILEEIRSDIRRHGDVIAAISPYMMRSKLLGIERRWQEWCELLRAREAAGQLSTKRLEELEGHLSRGHLDAIRARPLHGIDFAALEALQADLFARKLAPKSVHHVLADVRTFLRWCARRGWLHAVPEIPVTLVPEYAPTIPTREEQRRRLDAIEEPERGYFLARGLLGIRNLEAIRARISDYRRGRWDDAAGAWIDELVVRGKGRRMRVLPVPAELARWVRAHRPALAEAGAPLFIDPKAGRSPSQSHLLRVWRAMERRLGLPHVKPNEALRHTFATRAVERLIGEGMSAEQAVAAIQPILGHTSRTSTDRYVKLAAEIHRGTIE